MSVQSLQSAVRKRLPMESSHRLQLADALKNTDFAVLEELQDAISRANKSIEECLALSYQPARAPTLSAWRNLCDQLAEQPFTKLEPKFADLLVRHRSAVERTGYADTLLWAEKKTITVLISCIGTHGPSMCAFASKFSQEALRWRPNDPQIWWRWVRMLRASHQHAAMEVVLSNMVRRFPDFSPAYHRLAMYLARDDKRVHEAVSIARSATKRTPNDLFSKGTLLNCLLAQCSVKADVEAARIAVYLIRKVDNLFDRSSKSTRSSGLNAIAKILLRHDEFDGPFKTIAKALPQKSIYMNMLAYHLMLLTAFDQAILVMRDTVRRFPDDPVCWRYFALALDKPNKNECSNEAIQVLRCKLSVFPDDLPLRLLIIEIFNKTNDTRLNQLGARYLRRLKLRFGEENFEHDSLDEAISSEERDKMIVDKTAEQFDSTDAVPEIVKKPSGGSQIVIDLPPEIELSAKLLRTRIGIEYEANPTNKDVLIDNLRAIFNANPTFAYAKILAIRHGVWVADTKSDTVFSIAFETALRELDCKQLSALANKFPAFQALSIVGKALSGDLEAGRWVDKWLRAKNDNQTEPVQFVHGRLQALRVYADGTRDPTEVIQKASALVLTTLYDANELIVDSVLAA